VASRFGVPASASISYRSQLSACRLPRDADEVVAEQLKSEDRQPLAA